MTSMLATSRTLAVGSRAGETVVISILLPRHTGEAGRGKATKRLLKISDLKLAKARLRLSPSGPAGHLPRMTGEEEVMPSPALRGKVARSAGRGLALLRAVARGDLLLGGVLAGDFLHQRLDDGVVGREP